VPDDVTSLAEESLLWQNAPPGTPCCPGLCFDLGDPQKFFDQNCSTLEKIVRANPWHFGLCENSEHPDAASCKCRVPAAPRAVRSVNMVIRGGNQRTQVEFIAHIVGHAPLYPGDKKRTFKGGATVVFDASGNAKLIIYKKLSSKTRRDELHEKIIKAGTWSNRQRPNGSRRVRQRDSCPCL